MALAPAAQKVLAGKRQQLFDLEKNLELVEAGKIAAGGVLQVIRDEGLWSVDPDRAYASFENYCELRWGFGKREADRKIDAFNNSRLLLSAGVAEADLPRNPWQAREIAVLVNRTDAATAAVAWKKALVDSADPKINPDGRLTGKFLKGYVDDALAGAGSKRKTAGVRAAQPASAPAAAPSVVNVTAHTRAVGGAAAQAVAPSTNGVQIIQPAGVDALVLFELADDIVGQRHQISNPLARKPIFDGVSALLRAIGDHLDKVSADSPEGVALKGEVALLATRFANVI